MIRAIWEYIRERKWRYVKIAMVLILYDYTLLIPTQVIQRLVDHLSQQTLTQSNFVWDMGPIGRVSHPQLFDGFLLAVATLSVVSPFQGDPSGSSVS